MANVMVLNKKTLVIIASLSGLVLLFIVGINSLLDKEAKRLEEYKQEVSRVGLSQLKEECLNEGLSAKICVSIVEPTVSVTECGGKVCWIVYAISDYPGYGGGVNIIKDGNEFKVVKYTRNTGIQ